MASIVNFNNRAIIEPGVYARTLGTVETVLPQGQSNILLWIDTGNLNTSNGFGGGIAGELTSGKPAVYFFSKAEDVKKAVGGGILYGLADVLFKPTKSLNVPGIGGIYYVRAATTVAASVTFAFTGGGANGGSFVIKSKTEGLAGNGASNGSGSSLSQGFAAHMKAGRLDTTKFRIVFYRGSYTGLNTTVTPNVAFNGIVESQTLPIEILETPEFNNATELAYFFSTDAKFNAYFKATTATVSGTGAITSADLTTNSAIKLFSGGTQTFATTHLDTVLESVNELDYTFVMTDRFGSTITDSYCQKIVNHIKTGSDYEQFFIAPAGLDKNTADDPLDTTNPQHSVQVAQYYNTPRVYVVHGDVYRKSPVAGQTNYRYNVLWTAALMCGRMAGVPPQVPVTWLDIDIEGVLHDCSKKERERFIQTGVLHLRNVSDVGGWVINQDINSMQNNIQDVYPDGTSPQGSIMRIVSSLNKGAIQGLRATFIAGRNVNTSSPIDLKLWMQNYLQQNVATAQSDDLILDFKNVTVDLQGSDYYVNYSFTPNGPINRIFLTGFMLPVSLTA